MNTLLLGIMVVGGTTILAVLGMILVRKLVPIEKILPLHEVAGYFLSVTGTMYALLLALVVVDAMTNMQQARMTVEQEANSLADVFRLSSAFDTKTGLPIRRAALKYAVTVIEKEWDTMEDGQQSEEAWEALHNLWETVRKVEPVSEKEKTFHASMVDSMRELGDDRRTRLVTSEQGISPLLWAVLIGGGAATIIFTFFFAVESIAMQAIMTGLVAVTIALNVFLVAVYGYPFKGTYKVSARPMQLDIDRFNRWFQTGKDAD